MNHAQLTALGRALRVLGEHGEKITSDTPDSQLHELKGDLRRAMELLEETVTTAAPATRCPEHPNGPVDRSAPDLCLLCETRRRSGRRARLSGGPVPDRPAEPVPSRYGMHGDRPQPQQRWLPEAWNGRAWELCGAPRRDRREAELFLAAERRGPRPAMAYRLVHEFTDYEVLRVWGEPRVVPVEPMG
ncbi:hypothetical protein [Streptomyces sp. NPDC047130]|uniref:hypothetical protein n=1 Tax=Streptomyces sp. NPDC047130 TaxID=3155261 RepID=UPI0033FA9D27